MEKQRDSRFSEATDCVLCRSNAVVFIDGTDLMVDEVEFEELLEFCRHELAAFVRSKPTRVSSVYASDESTVCVNEVILPFHEFNDACARVTTHERYVIVYVSNALCAHFS